MTEDIIRMARKADPDWDYDRDMVEWLERFAAIVIANNPPQTFMSYQEGYAAGVAAEREACAQVLEMFAPMVIEKTAAHDFLIASVAAIRARSKG